jgi:hypothetical protein
MKETFDTLFKMLMWKLGFVPKDMYEDLLDEKQRLDESSESETDGV